MNFVPEDRLIITEERQRRIFDEASIRELADSIAAKGLMHPIVLREDCSTLVAGERRIRAMRLLHASGKVFKCNGVDVPPNQFPFIRLDSLSPLEIEEAELEENVIRKDLSWQEHNFALARLHRLREKQMAAIGAKQTLSATVAEVFGVPITQPGEHSGRLREALVIADHLHDPEIANAKDAKEAMKILRKRADAQHREELAKDFDMTKSEHEVLQGSAFVMTPLLAGDSIDVILTDPPYGIDADKFGSQADATHEYEDSPEFALECYSFLFDQANRVCRKNAALFAFCDIRMFDEIFRKAQQHLDHTWGLWQTPLIWDKGNGMLPNPEKGPRRCYEAVFYAYRGSRRWNATGSSDVMSIPGVQRPDFGAQKPVDLYLVLLGRVSLPGDTVLDPFAGTGPVIGAAKILQCKAITFELNQKKVDYAITTYLKEQAG